MSKYSFLMAVLATFFVTTFTAGPLFAQQGKNIEEITVLAPRITREKRDFPPYGDVTVASKSATVNVADLDLSLESDMDRLKERVRNAAGQICNDLARELPFGQPSTAVCIGRAVEDTMAEVRDAIK